MKNVIISGADGFVGSHTVKCFLENGCNVLALGRKETPTRLIPREKLTYIQCDVFDTDSLEAKIPSGVYDTFVHFAWNGSAGSARTDLELQMRNAYMSAECVRIAKKLGCTRFVGAGSIMEYEVEAVIHAQGSKPGMGYIYGIGKQLAHGMCKTVAANEGIDFLWPMITNAYGEGETSPRFINTTLKKIINGEDLNFTSGTQNYDFVYVGDVAEAFYHIAKDGNPFSEYMIGSGYAKPLKEFILEMTSACDTNLKPVFGDVPFTGVSLPLEVFGIEAMVTDCNFCPKTSFTDGIKKTMQWLKTR